MLSCHIVKMLRRWHILNKNRKRYLEWLLSLEGRLRQVKHVFWLAIEAEYVAPHSRLIAGLILSTMHG